MSALRATLRAIDPDVPLGNVATMAERAGDAVSLPRLYALLLGIFAAAAGGLATVGVYGVMAHAVVQRRREIGVRLALGATPAAIQRQFLRDGGRLTVAGVGIGLIGAALISNLMARFLFQVGARDAFTYLIVGTILAAMSVAASWLPARRAMAVDPLVAIRED